MNRLLNILKQMDLNTTNIDVSNFGYVVRDVTQKFEGKDLVIAQLYTEKIQNCIFFELPNGWRDELIKKMVDLFVDFLEDSSFSEISQSKKYAGFIDLLNKVKEEIKNNWDKYDPSGGTGDVMGL